MSVELSLDGAIRSPLVDERGYVTRPWLELFRTLYMRMGRARALSNDELTAVLSDGPPTAAPQAAEQILEILKALAALADGPPAAPALPAESTGDGPPAVPVVPIETVTNEPPTVEPLFVEEVPRLEMQLASLAAQVAQLAAQVNQLQEGPP